MKKTRQTAADTDGIETAADIFHRLGDPDPRDGAFVWKIAWLVDQRRLPRQAVYMAASGPKMVGGVGNPVGYFHVSLRNEVGAQALKRALRRLPRRREWPTHNPNLRYSADARRLADKWRVKEPPTKTEHDLLVEIALALKEYQRDDHARLHAPDSGVIRPGAG